MTLLRRAQDGNLLSKSDVGAYTYPLAGSALPHAVTSISAGLINTTFTYDPSFDRLRRQPDLRPRPQHQLHLLQQAVVDHPRDGHTLFFSHEVDHQRFKQVSPEGTTRYFDAFGGPC